MGSTTLYGLRYPEYATGADPKRDIQYLAEDIAPKLYRAEPLTSAQITAIASPRIGQLVFNTDASRTQEWNGTVWRSIGAGAYGSISQTVTITASTWVSVSFFVGLALTECEFTWNGATFAFRALVSASAANAQIASYNSGGASFSAPVDATTAVIAGLQDRQARNLRLTSDGFVRFELFTSVASAVTHTANWRAR